MNQNNKFSWKKRIDSFKYAFKGINKLFKYEHNARIHLVVAFLVIIAAFIFKISVNEWIAVVFCIASVFASEAFNSAIEALADKISPQRDPWIEKAKDLSAAAVLFFAIASVIIGLTIFIPYIL